MRLCRLRQVNPNSRLSVPVNNVLILSRLLVTGRETISKFHTETIPRPRNASATSAFRDRELATRPLDNRIAFYPLNWKLWLFPGARGEVRREREGEINFVTGSRCRERERESRNRGREGKGRKESERREMGRGTRRKAVAGRENRGDVHAFNR